MKSKLHSSDRKKTAALLPLHRSVTTVTVISVPALLTWAQRVGPDSCWAQLAREEALLGPPPWDSTREDAVEELVPLLSAAVSC